MFARVKNLRGVRRDLALAAIALVNGLVETIASSAGDRWAVLPTVLLIAAGTAVRSRLPIGGMILAFAGMLWLNTVSKEATEGLFGPFLFLLLAVFTMSLHNGGRRLYAGTAAAWLIGVVGTQTDQYDDGFTDLIFVTLLMVGFPVLAGQLLRSRIRLTAALREKAERLEREREAGAQQAALQERERIASELHDVVAHALGAMTIQASAARRLATKDPERAASAFQAVEQTGREALTELRNLLGVLRHEDEQLALAPQPSLTHLNSLVKRVRAAGLPVDVEIEGEAVHLPAGVDVAAYRLIQEALGEALRAGEAGHADVRVRYGNEVVDVEVRDDGRGGKRRLLGMRERVGVFGGTIEAGPRRDGGHVVRAHIPVERAAA